MIIDDEPWALARLESIVDWNAMGFEIVCRTGDSAEAWDKMRKCAPDAVFTDINMPGFTGLELLENARNLGITAEFVIVSGYDDFAYAQQAIKSGIFYYILKPLQKAEFEKMLQKLRHRLDEKAALMPKADYCDSALPHTESECLNKIIGYIDDNYSKQMNLAEISGEFFVSQTYICDLFNKYLGTTFVKYLNTVRMGRAEQLLARGDAPVSEIALKTGFSDYSYFSKKFKQQFGVSPSEYRAEKRS